MTCSVILVNYNTLEITRNCINSIFLHTKEVNFELIVVDNNSSDGSVEEFSKDERINLVVSKENIGFGRANNLGSKIASGEFLFFLNSDTLLKENSILKMLSFFENHEKKLNIGVLGCLLVDRNNSINGYGNSFPTSRSETEKQWSQVPLIRNFVTLPKINNLFDDEIFFKVDYVIGADMLMRRSLFEKMNGFYQGFFMYYEETDLQKRITDYGLKQYIFKDTRIIHLEEASGNAIQNYSNKKRMITHKSRVLYLKRCDSKRFYKFAAIDFLFLVLNFFNFKYTFKENFLYFREVVKAYLKK